MIPHLNLAKQEVSVLTDLLCNLRGTGKRRLKAPNWIYKKKANIHVFYNMLVKKKNIKLWIFAVEYFTTELIF